MIPRSWSVVALAVAIAMSACGRDPTSIRLEVDLSSSPAVDALRISTQGLEQHSAVAPEVLLLVPDDWTEGFVELDVDGLAGDAVVANGRTEVALIQGETVRARVRLVDAACASSCALDASRCIGDGVVRCVVGANGCPVWSEPTDCPDGAPFCSEGACSATCTDDCVPGQRSCDGTAVERACGQGDSDPCADWISTACDADATCNADRCVATCPATCAIASVDDAAMPSGDLAVDATHVYWIANGGDAIHRRAKAQGTAEVFAAGIDGANGVSQIAIDDTHLYWAATDTRRVWRRVKTGGASELFTELPEEDDQGYSYAVRGVYLDGDDVWVEIWRGQVFIGSTIFASAPKTGGTLTGQFEGFGGTRMLFDANAIYYDDLGSGNTSRLWQCPRAGGSCANIVSRNDHVHVDDTHVYFVGDALRWLATSGGTLAILDPTPTLSATAADGRMFWSPQAIPEIRIRAKGGGPVRTIALPSQATGLTVRGGWLYWRYASQPGIARAPLCACAP